MYTAERFMILFQWFFHHPINYIHMYGGHCLGSRHLSRIRPSIKQIASRFQILIPSVTI